MKDKPTKRKVGHPKQDGVPVMIQIRVPSTADHDKIVASLTPQQRGQILLDALKNK